jgi:TPR repeat protein
MNWQAIVLTGAVLFFGIFCVQAANGQPDVREEAGRSSMDDTYWKLPNASSIKAYRRGAEDGFAPAQFKLALLYYNGQGVGQDYVEAAKWFRKSAEQGYASAQKNLGVMYGKGQGLGQSHYQAYVWAGIATMSGDEGAIVIRDYAASKLRPEDLDAAQERAAKLYQEIQQRALED